MITHVFPPTPTPPPNRTTQPRSHSASFVALVGLARVAHVAAWECCAAAACRRLSSQEFPESWAEAGKAEAWKGQPRRRLLVFLRCRGVLLGSTLHVSLLTWPLRAHLLRQTPGALLLCCSTSRVAVLLQSTFEVLLGRTWNGLLLRSTSHTALSGSLPSGVVGLSYGSLQGSMLADVASKVQVQQVRQAVPVGQGTACIEHLKKCTDNYLYIYVSMCLIFDYTCKAINTCVFTCVECLCSYYVFAHVCVYYKAHVHMHACNICMYLCVYACMYTCKHACMNALAHECHICICIYACVMRVQEGILALEQPRHEACNTHAYVAARLNMRMHEHAWFSLTTYVPHEHLHNLHVHVSSTRQPRRPPFQLV